MPTPTEIVRKMSPARFAVVLAESPKQLREQLFRKANVKVKGNAFSLAQTSKNTQRAERLHEALVGGTDLGDDALEELIRNYLYTQRPLLAAALDAVGVKHEQGLTDEDLDFLSALPPDRAKALRATLLERFASDDVHLYLEFMRVPAGEL